MRQQFIAIEDAPTMADAEIIASWACKIIEVEGGWHAFESWTDYETWCNQV